MAEKPRNPKTTRHFRREAFWQITFPVILVSLLVIGLVTGLAIFAGMIGISAAADYVLALMIFFFVIPLFLGVAALCIGLIYLMGKLQGAIPPYAFLAQKTLRRVYLKVDQYTDKVAGIVIDAKSYTAGISSLFSRFTKKES